MKYTEVKHDRSGEVLYYEIRNDAGMIIGTAFQNPSPFEGCEAVTLEDAEKNARLWAAADELLEALEKSIPYIKTVVNKLMKGEPDEVVKNAGELLSKCESAINKAKGITKPELI